MKEIGQDIDADFEQLQFTGGYDHNFVTDNYAPGNVRHIAEAFCQETGIAMSVSTDCPGVQFYAGNFIENEAGKNGHTYENGTVSVWRHRWSLMQLMRKPSILRFWKLEKCTIL